jgi:hypothetical protein
MILPSNVREQYLWNDRIALLQQYVCNVHSGQLWLRVTAVGSCQRSHSRFRVRGDTRPYFTATFLPSYEFIRASPLQSECPYKLGGI